ncbi:MCP four helix bundle domain-containing protein [Desulforamulus aeronauticus]|uniref:Four helix bundle sensory module for signal transduction n=1 Tax=Desulforamulus aeronauticus DSM 10349 TaxID=1121421 RepID=A0A1M6QTR6_9FIRM|nr:MCP four helix bundle domain-containing protein [Desulforamulus aeronauticus]SHK23596.1 Four helix bundle sensory module for signal transduction [Desulforamulus aeronauticus DSM 10349]
MSRRVFGTFLVIIIVMLATSSVTISKLFTMNSNAREIAQTWVPSIQLMGWMNGAVSDVPRLVLQITLETETEEMTELEKEELKPLLKQIQEKLVIYEKQYISNKEEAILYEHFKEKWVLYLNHLPSIVAAGKENKFDVANRMIKETYPIWQDANNTINQIIDMKNKEAQRASQSSFTLFESSILLILFLNLIAFILIATIVLWMSSKEFKELIYLLTRSQEK